MLQDRLQYFSVDSQQINQPNERQNHNQSQSSQYNNSASAKKKYQQGIQNITPTKKESDKIKSSITNILNQVLQRNNDIPIETQIYLKERFNTSIHHHNLNHSQNNFENLQISPQTNNDVFQGVESRIGKQRSQNQLQLKMESELQQIQYLDQLIEQEKEEIKDVQKIAKHSPQFPNEQKSTLSVEQLLKDRENFCHNNTFEVEQFNTLSPKSNTSPYQTLSKSQSLKQSITDRISAVNSNKKGSLDKRPQQNKPQLQKKDLTSLDSDSIQIQLSENNRKKSPQIIKNFSKTEKKKNEFNNRVVNNIEGQNTSLTKPQRQNNMKQNQDNSYLDTTVYQRILRERQLTLTTERQNEKKQNSTSQFSSSNNLRGRSQDKYDSVKKELFKDFQSFSDQFVQNKQYLKQINNQGMNQSVQKKQKKSLEKNLKEVTEKYQVLSENNQDKKYQVNKLETKYNNDVKYLHKLKNMVDHLRKDNKRLLEPLNTQAQRNEEKLQIEKNIKKQDQEIKQLEKENLNIQTQLKRAYEELNYWQNHDKPKEIKLSLNNSTNSSTYGVDNPIINIKINQSDIYDGLVNNNYNQQI